MHFMDRNDGRICTPADLKKEWEMYRVGEPENHAADFKTEFFEILMAAINGRNDLDVIGLTPQETGRLIHRLRVQVLNESWMPIQKPVDFSAGQSE